jgi:hypothetical protein
MLLLVVTSFSIKTVCYKRTYLSILLPVFYDSTEVFLIEYSYNRR